MISQRWSEHAALAEEVAELQALCDLAKEIGENAKGGALLKALETAFAKAAELGAAQKALIFTESRRTQEYLLRLLADSPYHDGIVLFNGTNSDDRSKLIYMEWIERHRGTDRGATGVAGAVCDLTECAWGRSRIDAHVVGQIASIGGKHRKK